MSSLFATWLAVSLSTAVIIALLLALSPLLAKRFTAKWKYWLWLILAVRLLLPFQLPLPQPAAEPVSAVQITVPQLATEPLAEIIAPTAGEPTGITEPDAPAGTAPAAAGAHQATPAAADPWYYQLSLLDIAAYLWLAGAVLFLLWHGGRYWQCKRELARWRRPYQSEVLEQLGRELGCRKLPPLYLCAKAPGPMMIGFLHPVLYLPELPQQGSDLYFILKHELIHWQRRDVWYKLLFLTACAVHWFNPLVHVAFRAACRDLELACDEAVVAKSGAAERKQYSEAIFNYMKKQVCRPAQLSTYFDGGLKTMKQRFHNILSTAVKRRGRAALVAALLVLIAAGGLFACSIQGEDTPPAASAEWPQDIIADLGTMDEQQLRDYLSQPIADGTVEEIAQQVISQDIASYFLNEYVTDAEQALIVDAEIISLELIASYDENSEQPLYVYSPQYRLKPDDADKVIFAGARQLDEDGWIINSAVMNSWILVTPTEDGRYSFLGFPAVDLPVNEAVRRVLYGEDANMLMDFTFFGTNFYYGLGRQLGEYPWAEGYNEQAQLIDAGTLDNTDMPGAVFSRALIDSGSDGQGETEMIWYRIEETGREYIYRLATTDPYVSCGVSGSHQARVGQSEDELLAAWGDVLSENDLVYSGDGSDLCVFDQSYSYTAQVSDGNGYTNLQLNFYLSENVITGIEMMMLL